MNNDISLRTNEILTHDMKEYGDMIFRIAFSYMKNTYDSEDILQDVLFKLIKNDNNFNDEAHKKAWIIQVTRNLCKNKLMSSWFKHRNSLDEEIIHYDKYNDGTVLKAVMDLPQKYREVIHLYYYEDYKTQEIASIINKKESTVRSLLYRARDILKKELKEAYDFE